MTRHYAESKSFDIMQLVFAFVASWIKFMITITLIQKSVYIYDRLFAMLTKIIVEWDFVNMR
jgi:hypothetical protein